MTDRPPLRIGALLLAGPTWPRLRDRAREAEALGFDFVCVDDHAVHPARPADPWLEVWTALSAIAGATHAIAIGPLVCNIVLRHPVLLARQARTVEQVSGGRLELAVGSGYAPTDHAAVGAGPWTAAERADRFAEAVGLLDALMRGGPVTREGPHYPVRELTLAPPPLIDPRPPLAVAAHGPRALAVAAAYADVWVSYGAFSVTAEASRGLTRARARTLDRACTAIGRDPRSIRHRLLAGSAALTSEPMWTSADAFAQFVTRAREDGIDELALHWPPEDVNPAGAIDPRGSAAVVADALSRLR